MKPRPFCSLGLESDPHIFHFVDADQVDHPILRIQRNMGVSSSTKGLLPARQCRAAGEWVPRNGSNVRAMRTRFPPGGKVASQCAAGKWVPRNGSNVRAMRTRFPPGEEGGEPVCGGRKMGSEKWLKCARYAH